MEELGNAIGRFAAGLSDVDELRAHFRGYLQRNPGQRDAVSRWLQEGAQAGQLTPAILLTIGDVVAASAPTAPAAAAAADDPELTNVRAAPPVSVTPAADAVLVPGSVLDGRYTLVEQLGHGGMGTVFKARDRNREMFQDRHHPFIALKVLSEEFKQHPDARMALQRETVRAQSLAHPNVVTVYDFDYDGEHAYMTMELLDGQPLDEWLQSEACAQSSLQTRWQIVRGIGAGLSYAHQQGVVHSDLKPGNIFLCKSGVAKVMDFGIARPLSQVPGQASTTLFDPAERLGGLTPAYAALEQWNRAAPDPRDDIYAFSCVVYAIFSGQHPFGLASARAAFQSQLAPTRIDSLSRRQWDTLRRGLALQRANRIPSIEEFLAQFAPQTWRQKHRSAMLAVALTTIAAALFFGARAYRVYVEDTASVREDEALNASLWPKVDAAATPLTEEQQRDVADLLYLGQDALHQAEQTQSIEDLSSMLSRGDNNVHDLLRRIRTLDPANAPAITLTTEAAHLYAERASQLLAAHKIDDAAKLVLEGQTFQHNQELLRIKQQICRSSPAACGRF